jgi:sulfatase modifying factor 1
MRAPKLETGALLLLALAACDRGTSSSPPAGSTAPAATSAPVATASASVAPASGSSAPASPAASGSGPAASGAASAAAPAGSAYPGRTDGCAAGMVRVEGEYCPELMQDCVEHHKEFARNKADKNVSERCLRYAEPSRCVSKKRVHLSFCMDRFEYPNQPGELPRVLTQWTEAVKRCEEQGKRLCTEDEFNFACEGPEMLPYVYGYTRDAAKCNIDRFYHRPDHKRTMRTYDRCLETPWCAEELKRLDQRHRIGERMTCVSWAGNYDLNGNVNEWVNLPGKKSPDRSGLKGGWWGPVRSRCRPTVTFHKEEDYGYEAGFRCCADAR